MDADARRSELLAHFSESLGQQRLTIEETALRDLVSIRYTPAMSRNLALAALMCALLCCGCGTFSDLICGAGGGGPYYRGVRMDVMAIREGHPLAPLLAADVPFSAAADTAMVPYVAYQEAKAKQEASTE